MEYVLFALPLTSPITMQTRYYSQTWVEATLSQPPHSKEIQEKCNRSNSRVRAPLASSLHQLQLHPKIYWFPRIFVYTSFITDSPALLSLRGKSSSFGKAVHLFRCLARSLYTPLSNQSVAKQFTPLQAFTLPGANIYFLHFTPLLTVMTPADQK